MRCLVNDAHGDWSPSVCTRPQPSSDHAFYPSAILLQQSQHRTDLAERARFVLRFIGSHKRPSKQQVVASCDIQSDTGPVMSECNLLIGGHLSKVETQLEAGPSRACREGAWGYDVRGAERRACRSGDRRSKPGGAMRGSSGTGSRRAPRGGAG